MTQSDKTTMEIVHSIVDEAFQDDDVNVESTFTDDTLTIEIPDQFVEPHTDISTETLTTFDCVTVNDTNDSPTLSIQYDLWMTTRRANQEEVDAALEGVEDAQSNSEPQDQEEDFTESEVAYYRKGYEEALPGQNNDPEEVMAGRIPVVILYHRDNGYSGPKHMGRAIDFNGVTDYNPTKTAQIIENGEMILASTDHFPQYECETNEGDVYTFSYWIGK